MENIETLALIQGGENINDKLLLHIHVPISTQVCRINGRIYDRNEDSDIDITNNSDAVYQAYARKQGTYHVNKVTYKYTQLYSGQEPQFIEGADVFRTIVPLSAVAAKRVGPQVERKTQVNLQVNPQVNLQVNPQVNLQVNPQVSEKILSYCAVPRAKAEIAEYCGYKDKQSFTLRYLKHLLDSGMLLMTIPDKPRSRNQKYVTARFGEAK